MTPSSANKSSSSTNGSSSGVGSPPHEKIKKTRNRIPQSCSPCRKRKLKCDRQHPACENCVKRGDAESCEYVEAPEDEKTRALRARLEYLEAQVREISSSLTAAEIRKENDNSDETETKAIVEQMARLKLRTKDDKAAYFGPNCRYGMIHEFPEIFAAAHKGHRDKKWTCPLEDDRDANQDFPLSAFPFNIYSSEINLRALLPERSLCDRLIGRYFLCCNSVFNIIDSDTFYNEQYPAMWSATSASSGHLALVFLMLAIAARSLNPGNPLLGMLSDEGQQGAMNWCKRWRKYGQLALSQNKLMHRSSLGSIQAMLLLALVAEEDNVRWNLTGMVATMAKIGGLFRDPNKFANLDDKTRNLRRRLWSYIVILDHTESIHYGVPPCVAPGTFDCEPILVPSSYVSNSDNTFMYWLFKLHAACAESFPGVVGIQKSLRDVKTNDQKIWNILNQLPPELSLPPGYIPALSETPLEIIRRFAIHTIAQGHFVTLHRPYIGMSDFSKEAAINATWTLAQYQSQLITLWNILEPYDWFIEEFLDGHLIRAVAYLGCILVGEPTNPLSGTIVRQVEIAAEHVKSSMRLKDHTKAYHLLKAILNALADKHVLSAPPQTSPLGSDPYGDENIDAFMEDVFTETNMFKWDEYLVDMVMDSRPEVA